MRLGTRLAVAFAILAIVVAAVVGFAGLQATSVELDSSVDQFLASRSAEIVEGIRERPGNSNGNGNGRRQPPIRFDGVVGLFSTDADSIVQTIRPDGTLVNIGVELPVTDAMLDLAKRSSGNDRDSELIKLSRYDDITIEGEAFRMITTPLPDGGAVQIARSTEENSSVVTALGSRLAVIALLTAIVAALLGWLVARRVTRPLRRLSGVAAGVAETRDFSTPVDVSGGDEVGQLAASLREMLDALEQSREQQQRLVHDAGHELRTPLTSLRANVGLLERAPDLDPAERAEIVAALRAELVELTDLFDEMIDLAGDQYSTELHRDPLLLGDLVRKVADRWERRSRREISVEADGSEVIGDASMLDRAISNLLSNAHKFSPPGEAIDVELTAGRLVVRDHGPGVPVGDRTRIFDRFHRTEATRAMPGSGLGLAIVAQIVERHGGRVLVGDAPSGGAEIGFELPLTRSPIAPPSEPSVDPRLDAVTVEE